MSYAGPSRVHGSSRTTRPPAAGSSAATPHPSADDASWREAALFGTGLLLGLLVGVGSALLAAPQTGAETRAALGARASRLRRSTGRRGRDAWDELRDELQQARHALRRRKVRRARVRELEREYGDE